MNGVINIDKPAGMTSHDVVYRIRKLAKLKRVGHAGTLDPDATGVLLVCLGHATRLSDLLADQGKEYDAVLRLGATTTTEDASGEVITRTDPSNVTEADLANQIPNFLGTIEQIPPMVSAVHHDGQRLYELARKGITVEREARSIEISSIDLLSFSPGAECRATIRVRCGKGTYIRTLCADIGASLGVGGYMAGLRRTRVGEFGIANSVPLGDLSSENVADYVTPSADAVSFLPSLNVDDTAASDILNGKKISSPVSYPQEQQIRILWSDTLVALCRLDNDGWLHPEKVFPSNDL